MPFKTNRIPKLPTRLTGVSLLGFAGPDAAAFLQAQTMNDVRELAPGQWQWNGWLNPKGRLVCLFALLRADEQEFIAVLPDFPAHDLQPLLQRFVFRSKVRIEVIDRLVPGGLCDVEADATPEARHVAAGSPEEGYRLDLSGDGASRRLYLLPEASSLLAPADPDVDAEWLAMDLLHGLPRLDISQREAWTPQMLSLDRLRAFSLRKGCYPGQEIVARTHYLGQAKRVLTRVRAAGLVAGALLHDREGNPVGTVVSSASQGAEGLAVIQGAAVAAGAWLAGESVAMPDLAGGLQRPV